MVHVGQWRGSTRHKMEQAMSIRIWEEWDIKARLGHHLGNVKGYLQAVSFFPCRWPSVTVVVSTRMDPGNPGNHGVRFLGEGVKLTSVVIIGRHQMWLWTHLHHAWHIIRRSTENSFFKTSPTKESVRFIFSRGIFWMRAASVAFRHVSNVRELGEAIPPERLLVLYMHPCQSYYLISLRNCIPPHRFRQFFVWGENTTPGWIIMRGRLLQDN